MRKVVHLQWDEYNSLRNKNEDDCYMRGDAYISFEDNIHKYKEITDVREGYGRSNYTWQEFDIVVE